MDSFCLLALTVYIVITLSDLECDFLNATSCCAKLNYWVVYEAIGVCLHPSLFVLSSNYILFFLSLPLSCFLLKKYLSVRAGSIGLFDPTEIHNRGLLKKYMKEAMIKLGHHTIFFIVILYSFVYSLLSGNSTASSSWNQQYYRLGLFWFGWIRIFEEIEVVFTNRMINARLMVQILPVFMIVSVWNALQMTLE